MKIELVYGKYYWVRYKGEKDVQIAYYYDDKLFGSFNLCGSDDIFNPEDFEILGEISPYEN